MQWLAIQYANLNSACNIKSIENLKQNELKMCACIACEDRTDLILQQNSKYLFPETIQIFQQKNKLYGLFGDGAF